MTLRTVDYDGLKDMLPEDAKVLIWGCNTCARMCGGLGGRDAARSLATMLEEDGWTVAGGEVLTAACFESALRKRLERNTFREMLERATHVIALTCRTGLEVLLKEMPHLQDVNATLTVGLGYLSDTRGPILTDPLVPDCSLPEGGMILSEVADRLGLQIGPFER